jgi:Cadherin-like beta sandwich domain
MRYLRSQRNMVWTVLFLLFTTLFLNACSDANNVTGPPEPPPPVPLSPDAKLSSLTVNTGSLEPAFSSDVANYTVDVATSVTSVTVTARPQNANASMTINGEAAASGQSRTVTLRGAGLSTTIPIVVTAVNGSQNTYIVTVSRAAPGGNNNLQSLTVSPGPLVPTFIASTTSYSVNVASTVASVTVTAALQDTNASMTVNGQGTSSGQARTISLNGPGSSTLVTIEVTAPNGSQKTYLVTVNRTALGGNNNLQSLTLSPGTLTPSFTMSRLVYTVNVASTVDSVTVTAQPQDPGATVSIDGQPTTSRSVSLGAPESSTEILIEVMAPNGNQKTYAVTVNRAALGGNNNLQSLSVSPGTLAPSFSASTTDYTVNVVSAVASVTVTAQPQDAGATVSIDGQPATSRSVSLGAAGSSTEILIGVMAPNGSQKTYTVTVNRAAIVLSGNNNLSDLVVSAGPLNPPFDAGTTSYDVLVPIGTADTTVTATVADSTATLTINGSPATSGVPSTSIPLALGANPISIVVTAENGSPKTYTVTITRIL